MSEAFRGLLELLTILVDRLGIQGSTGREDLVLVFLIHFLDGFFVRNPFNAFFRGLKVQLQRTFDRNASVTEGFDGEDFTLLGFLEVPIHPHDLVLVGLADKLALTTEGLTHLGRPVSSIDQLDLAFAFSRLVIRKHPHIGGDSRVVEHIRGQGYDGFDHIVLQQVAPNFGLTTAGTARKQRAAIENDADPGIRLHGHPASC